MIKLVAGVRARDGVGRDELRQHWRDVHAPNVVEGVHPKRYTLTFFDVRTDGGDAPYDGIASLWFDSLEQYQQASAADSGATADGFVDLLAPNDTFILFTTEIVALDGAVTSNSAKATFFVQRLPDTSEADYFQHWREKHIPNVRAALQRNGGGLRYVVSQADLGQPGRYSGLAELYWQDSEAQRAGLPGVGDDGFRGMSEPYYGILGHEVVIVG